jgi:hypothetical protein
LFPPLFILSRLFISISKRFFFISSAPEVFPEFGFIIGKIGVIDDCDLGGPSTGFETYFFTYALLI